VDQQVFECDKWKQKYVFRERCLAQYEADNKMGFIPNYGSNLIEYYYGSLGPKTTPVGPFIAKSNITISQIEEFLCNNELNCTFNSIPFKYINETDTIAVNHTVYAMKCKAFERVQKDRATRVFLHHKFEEGKMFPSEIRNKVPPNFDLMGKQMPLLFNRTETN
jgi:hypothetical protein